MIEKLELIMNKMNDIKYGFVENNKNIYLDNDENWDNTFSKSYRLQISNELLKTKYGVCWDQVELERYYLNEIGAEAKSYFIVEYDDKQCSTHTFIVVKDNNKYFWFEHSWEPYRGIHEFNNLNELLLDIKDKFKKMLIKRNISTKEIVIYEYTEPKSNLNCLEFYKHCEQGTKIISDD